MRVQIKQRVFSIGDKYDILDFQNQPIFHIRSHPFAFGNKLDLLDMSGNMLARIQQRVFSLTSEYDILQGDQIVAVVKKQIFSLFQPRFDVEGPGGTYEMEGDWINWNYVIRANGQTIAQIGKQFAFFQDCYGMEIAEGADVPLLVCLAVVIDEIAHPDK